MLNWYAVSSTDYHAAEAGTLSNDNLYFLTDTNEIYRGSAPFSEAVILYTGTKPANPARKKIYVDTTTLKGEVYTGSEWVTVIKPVVSTVTANGTDPVNSTAVIDYVADEIEKITGSSTLVSDVSYNKNNVTLTVTSADDSTKTLELEGLGVQLSYDDATGALQLKDCKGTVLGSTVNLDLERFVTSADYDPNTKTIHLYFDNPGQGEDHDPKDTLSIPVGDLVDTYDVDNTGAKGVVLSLTNNKFTAEAVVAATAGNLLQLTNDGLYVAASTLDAYQTLVASADTTKIPMLNANGQLINGTMTPGGATIAATPNATTLATEAAVNTLLTNYKATVDAELATLMKLVNNATTGDIATFGTNGQVVDSGKVVGGATLAATPNANTLATEAAVKDAIDTLSGDVVHTNKILSLNDLSGSVDDTQVVSAAAVKSLLTWKTSL